MGLAIPCPAISGADPWVGSNIEGTEVSGFIFALDARPMLPVMIGGTNREEVRHFYEKHFIFSMPADVEFVPISRTVGNDTIVEESILRFTHAEEIDWILPGVAPTGRRVEIAVCTVVRMEGEKVAHEHVYWDPASVLAQLGLLDAETLPVVGAEAARQLPTPTGPLNHLIARVRKCCPRGESR